jgi:hypothetical protein
MTTFTCRHHNRRETDHGEVSHLYCGCDGTVHLACAPEPAPAGTRPPPDWPIFLSWRTLCAWTGAPERSPEGACDLERYPGSREGFCQPHHEQHRRDQAVSDDMDRLMGAERAS